MSTKPYKPDILTTVNGTNKLELYQNNHGLWLRLTDLSEDDSVFFKMDLTTAIEIRDYLDKKIKEI